MPGSPSNTTGRPTGTPCSRTTAVKTNCWVSGWRYSATAPTMYTTGSTRLPARCATVSHPPGFGWISGSNDNQNRADPRNSAAFDVYPPVGDVLETVHGLHDRVRAHPVHALRNDVRVVRLVQEDARGGIRHKV